MPKNILYIANPSNIHDLKWITFFSDQTKKFNAFIIYEKQLKINFEIYKNKLKNENITLLPPISSFSLIHPYSTIKSIISINNIISENKIDVVHILFATPHAFWGLRLKAPYLITTRGSDVLKVIPSLKTEKGLKGIYYNLLYFILKITFKKALAITSTSNLQIQKIYNDFSVISQLVRTGIDFNKIQKKINTSLLQSSIRKKKYIFSPRFFSPIYNIKIQIDAIMHLKKEIIDNYIFVFIKGVKYDTEYAINIEKKLSMLSESLNLKYLILDYLSQEEIWCYFQNTCLTIMTPISDGTPNSALEAMASKSPLIISDLPHLDFDLFNKSCIKYKNGNPEILAKTIEEALLNYPKKYLKKSLKNVETLGNRNIEMKKIEIIYNRI